MKDNALTERQQEILDFISDNIEFNGFPPTIPEMQKKFSFKSPTAVSDHLEALARKGYITRHPNKSRGIIVNDRKDKKQRTSDNVIELPVVGRIAAGTPILAQENIEDTVFVDRAFVKISHGERSGVFVLRVKGDSMMNAGIYDRDFIVVQLDKHVDQGEIAVVMVDDDATVKRFYKEDGMIRLQPENDSMAPIIIDPSLQNVSIIGRVKSVIRRM